MGVQGQDFKPALLGEGGKPSKGLKQAKLSPRTRALLEEVALSEQVSLHMQLLPCSAADALVSLLTLKLPVSCAVH